jgi:CubicO group peptidase (beta-lactamase class C family)
MTLPYILSQALRTAKAQLKKWNVASASVAVVKDGQVLFADGLGSKDRTDSPADRLTLYPIASCTKAFTATALALLATEGKLDFDKPVSEYLPELHLNDAYATAHLTIRDFLSHRSGLPRHEYAWYGTGFSRAELLRNLKDLPLNAPIRYRFQYSNFNYLIAGAVVEAVSGMPFETFLKEKLLRPLGMTHSLVYGADFRAAENRALAYDCGEEYVLGTAKQIPYYESPAEDPNARVGDPTAAAGCIISCAEDMARWLQFNLERGKVGSRQLVREDLMDLIATPHMFISDSCGAYSPQRTCESYALGWSVYNYRGYKMMEHGGNINGFTATTLFIPEIRMGVFVDVNQNVSLIADAISHSLVDALLYVDDITDWYARLHLANEELYQSVQTVIRSFGGAPVSGTAPSHPLADYTGRYEAPGYRRIVITEKNGHLVMDFNHFVVALRHHHYDCFATREPLGEFPSGLVLRFNPDTAGQIAGISITLGTEQDLLPIEFKKEV